MPRSYRSLFLTVLLLVTQHISAAPEWIEHASTPGPDQVVGESRFDQLFRSDTGLYNIPFPLEKLIDFLEARIDNGDRHAVLQILIPMGRSLQRDASAPHFFRYPRHVITVQGEPIERPGYPRYVMEYRLFIAHQPKTETLEVISYNDQAGRFEFQVVENYNGSKQPGVRSANRVMCLSCHQNAAAIFSTSPWDETNFNVRIAKALAAESPQTFPSLIEAIGNDTDLVDVLVERASYLSIAQFIWRNGCHSYQCRATMFRAVLQYRLTGESDFDYQHQDFQRLFVDELETTWSQQWPHGLALPNHRIPDHNPFEPEYSNPDQDPLFERPAHAMWQQIDPILLQGVVYRLSGFLSLSDIQLIDQHLIAEQETGPTSKTRYQASCESSFSRFNTRQFNCGPLDDTNGLGIKMEVDDADNSWESLRVTSLQLPGDNHIWQPRVAAIKQQQGRIDVKLLNANGKLSQRLANGDRISRLTVSWEEPFSTDRPAVMVELSDEFIQLDRALSRIVDKHRVGSASSLGNQAFIRQQLMHDLTMELGMRPPAYDRTLIASDLRPARISSGLSGDLALLEPYCGHCHGEPTVNPPGFLNGGNTLEKVSRCAPRILARLEAWAQFPDSTLSPMPPPASLGYSGSTSSLWPDSDHYFALVTAMETLTGSTQKALVNGPRYEALQTCLHPD